MTMPKFTAEASLYQTSGQYRTGRQTIYSSLRPISSIYPTVSRGEAPIDVPGEEIPVHGCAPGWIDIGGMCWPAPLTEPSSGGGSAAPGGGSSGSGPGGGVGGGGTPPKDKPKPPIKKKFIVDTEKVPPKKGFKPKQGGTCYGLKLEIGAGGDPIIWDDPFKGKYDRHRDSWQCVPKTGDSLNCNEKDVWNNGDEDIKYCYNKKPPYPPV
jgi:hypothetical protein